MTPVAGGEDGCESNASAAATASPPCALRCKEPASITFTGDMLWTRGG
eukprot:CAMPEP_0115393276 /NCGR_PEP_ID=MMETSP0271-20121206/11667_1 /TAXON_ID=71861 /ORGANISM="Scrippsiella trochoidea, Strain CCMP3099" /LENGTH=47 /DNA_ID= /DNA_START= /DNA_END= /DNA_ORIENTATION=